MAVVSLLLAAAIQGDTRPARIVIEPARLEIVVDSNTTVPNWPMTGGARLSKGHIFTSDLNSGLRIARFVEVVRTIVRIFSANARFEQLETPS
jgi:hypothetical protein